MTNATHVLDALGDPTRRAIFERLRRGPRSVGDLAEGIPVSRPAVSQHLRVLEDADLIAHTTEGTRHIYRIDTAGLEALRAYLDRFLDNALEAFKRAAEKTAKEQTNKEKRR